MIPVLSILIAQGLLGALDNLIHHEFQARLPSRISARWELSLHAAREAIYGVLFLALAWGEWLGVWAWLLAALLLVEIVITIADFLEEDGTRRLPSFERVLHTVLAISYGAFLAAFAPEWARWAAAPSGVLSADYCLLSWVLTLYAIGVLAWSVRNVIAVLGLYRTATDGANGLPSVPATGDTVLVTGGTGLVGSALVEGLIADGMRIILLTRDTLQAKAQFGRHVQAIDSLDLVTSETRVDAIVNLAGAPIIGGLWTRRRKSVLIDSRRDITSGLNALIDRLERPPSVLITASAVGYYGDRGTEPLAESAEPRGGFASRLCVTWEAEARKPSSAGVRVVALRFGLVLGRDGGVFPPLAAASWLGCGAVLGTGRQYMPWIHIDDAVGLIRFAMANDGLSGPVNATAPDCLPQGDFTGRLAAAQNRPQWFRVPASVLTVGLGEMSQILLDSQRVVPTKATKAGYRFHHATVPDALADLLGPRTNASALVPSGR